MTDSESPYQPPEAIDPPLPSRQPAVVGWFRAYCFTLAAIYVLVFIGCVIVAVGIVDFNGGDEEEVLLRAQAFAIGVISIPFGIFFGAVPFFAPSRTSWILGIVAIGLGMTSICCLPLTIPLLIQWIKPEVREAYGA